jgi:hypothetical protein
MVDIIGNGEFGRDDGIICNLEVVVNSPFGKQKRECGGKTFLVDDQGGGLKGYECEACGGSFQVEFESCDEEDESDEDYYEPPYDIYAEDVL